MRAKEMDTESLPREMETILKATGSMINEKVKALISIAIKISYLLESG
jgi:hypothetical protein